MLAEAKIEGLTALNLKKKHIFCQENVQKEAQVEISY